MKLQPLILTSLAALTLRAGTVSPGVTYLYTYNDRQGNVVINNMPPSYVRGQGLTLRHVGVGHVRLAMSRQEMAKVLRSPELLALVDSIAIAEGIDPYLARAVIQAESAFYARARSRTGALGLMQLMPQTAQRFGVVDPFDPKQNITGGVKYLKWLTDTFSGDLPKVVAAYNAGEGAVTKYGGIPPFAETRAYVPRVLELYAKRLVQPDPKAAGSMALLKKGRGGFQLDEAALRPGRRPGSTSGWMAPDACRSPTSRRPRACPGSRPTRAQPSDSRWAMKASRATTASA
jgi:hypothetical protein